MPKPSWTIHACTLTPCPDNLFKAKKKPWKLFEFLRKIPTPITIKSALPCPPPFQETAPPPCTRVKWVPLVLFAFLPCFASFFASKLDVFPLKYSVLGAWKGHFQAQDPKTTWNASKTRENVTTPQFSSLRGLVSNWAKNRHKTGEKNAKKTNGTYFARPINPPPPLKGGILWAWGLSSRKNQKILGAHKIGAAMSGPRIAGGKITDTRLAQRIF